MSIEEAAPQAPFADWSAVVAKRTVAILGASADRSKFGNKSVRAHRAAGFQVFPINPKEKSIEGLPCYESLAGVPAKLDRVSVYLPPSVGLVAMAAIAAANPREVWLNPGAESDEVLARGRELGLRMIVGCSIVDLGMSPSQFPG